MVDHNLLFHISDFVMTFYSTSCPFARYIPDEYFGLTECTASKQENHAKNFGIVWQYLFDFAGLVPLLELNAHR
jgi:hypothetical protein